MSRYPRFAPGTLPYYIDGLLWWAYRIAPVTLFFSVAALIFIGHKPLIIWTVIVSAIAWGGSRLARQLLLKHWDD